MAFNLDITTVRLQGVSIQGVTKATIVYSLVSSKGEVALSRRPVSFRVDLVEGQTIPTAQDLANLIAANCVEQFGGAPNTVVIQGANYTPALA